MCSNTETPMDVDDAKTVDVTLINEKTEEKNSNSEEKNETNKTNDTLTVKNDKDVDMQDVSDSEKNEEKTDVDEKKVEENVKADTEIKNSKHSNNVEDEKIQTNNDSTDDQELKTELNKNKEETEVIKKTENNVSEKEESDKDVAKSHTITVDHVITNKENIENKDDNNIENITTEKITEHIKAVENDQKIEMATKTENCTFKSENDNTNIDKTTNGDNKIDNLKTDTEGNEKVELQKDVSDAKEIKQQKTFSDETVSGKTIHNDVIEKDNFIDDAKIGQNGVDAKAIKSVSKSTDEKNEDVIKPSDSDGVSNELEINGITKVIEPEIKPTSIVDNGTDSKSLNVANNTETELMQTDEVSATESEINNKPIADKIEKMLTEDVVTEKTEKVIETKCDDIHIPVIKCESSDEKQESSNTTQTTESREIIEKNTETNKEKISRVEITIEQTDKQLGQTTQTTTHIVKEISITEQLVCGKKELSDTCKESVNPKEIEIKPDIQETITSDSKASEKLELEILENGNIETVTETNGNDDKKEGNDSDKENDEGEKSTPFINGDSKDSANDNLVKKIPEIISETPDATASATESATTHLVQSES